MAKKKGTLGTHDGRFHADEVTAAALLLEFGQIKREGIFRTRDPKVLDECEYVCDVGGIYDPEQKLFDHHQVNYTGPLSSAGMILLFLKERGLIAVDLYQLLYNELVQGVDAYDNGKELLGPNVTTFSHVISNFNTIIYDSSEEEEKRAFSDALSFAEGHIHRLVERFLYVQSCRETVKTAMKEGKTVLLFDRSIPWMDAFFELGGEKHPAIFVVMPAGKHWKLRGIPPSSNERMKVRHPLPIEWAGLLEDDIKKKTGIPGAIFCHKGRFISVWETREDALKALQQVLKES
jgi:uncharacterized UPF0160 family protein